MVGLILKQDKMKTITSFMKICFFITIKHLTIFTLLMCSFLSAQMNIVVTGPNRVYVDKNVTTGGAKNGTSWVDAYDDLNDALVNALPNDEIWIAAGVYNPPIAPGTNNTQRKAFDVDKPGLKIYGGFEGNELLLSDRIKGSNETIFSGDINNNDTTASVSFINIPAEKTDNGGGMFLFTKYSSTNKSILDGITIKNCFGGPAVAISSVSPDFSISEPNILINNCKFITNSSLQGAGLLLDVRNANNSATTTEVNIDINGCVFNGNASERGAGIYMRTNSGSSFRATQDVNLNISNNIFNNNKTEYDSGGNGIGLSLGSAFLIENVDTRIVANTKVVNNTFVNNQDNQDATSYYTGNTILPPTITLANNIYWNNISGLNAATAIELIEATFSISNSIDELNFSNVVTNKTDISNLNPLFTDAANGDFTLITGSPAIDAGLNSAVIGAVDIVGNNRIINTTVDVGAIEFDPNPVLSTDDLIDAKPLLNVYPNPTIDKVTVDSSVELKKISIINSTGQQILSTTKNVISLGQLPAGVYALQIQTENSIISKKIIKK